MTAEELSAMRAKLVDRIGNLELLILRSEIFQELSRLQSQVALLDDLLRIEASKGISRGSNDETVE